MSTTERASRSMVNSLPKLSSDAASETDHWTTCSVDQYSIAINNSPIGYAAGDANLYRYVGNQPTTKRDPSGLKEWDEESAREEVNRQIEDWRKDGYNLAADLLAHWLEQDGSKFMYTESHIKEICNNGLPVIRQKVFGEINRTHYPYGTTLFGSSYVYGTGTHELSIQQPKSEGANVRWWYGVSNTNMLYAFGGARVSVNGTFTVTNNYNWRVGRVRRVSQDLCVTIEDTYNFDTGGFKQSASSFASEAYEAAVYLDSVEGYVDFDHGVAFPLPDPKRH